MQNYSANSERAQAAMQLARQITRQAWLDTGVTEEELDQDDAIMALLENLARAGYSADDLLAEWQTKTPDQILREYAHAVPQAVSLEPERQAA